MIKVIIDTKESRRRDRRRKRILLSIGSRRFHLSVPEAIDIAIQLKACAELILASGRAE